MAADCHFTRLDTLKLKDHIFQRIGHQRAEKYFDHLNKFLGLKLSKAEFNKSCKQTIGRENLFLHNRLIRSILHNACRSKIPPRKARKVEAHCAKVTNDCQKSYLQSLYGDTFPQSPRKCRSPLSRDRKLRDRPSPLGPLGKSPSLTVDESASRLQEQQGTVPPFCFAPAEEGEEVEQFSADPGFWRWSSITAPLGVSLNTGRDCTKLCSGSFYGRSDETCQSSGELPDTRSLGRRLQKKLASEGVGISLDGAQLLNKGLDVFLKKIVSRTIDVAGSRRAAPPFIDQGESYGRMISGIYAENPMQLTYASMQDFRVAVETSPSLLGGDRSIQLYKINNNALQ